MKSQQRIVQLVSQIRAAANEAQGIGNPSREAEDENDTPEGRIDRMRERLAGIVDDCDELAKALKESRVEYVVQEIDRTNEARGAAIVAINAYRRAQMTPEQLQAKLDAENEDLFGNDAQRRGL